MGNFSCRLLALPNFFPFTTAANRIPNPLPEPQPTDLYNNKMQSATADFAPGAARPRIKNWNLSDTSSPMGRFSAAPYRSHRTRVQAVYGHYPPSAAHYYRLVLSADDLAYQQLITSVGTVQFTRPIYAGGLSSQGHRDRQQREVIVWSTMDSYIASI